MRLVAEIESRRRVRGATAPWTALSLRVRVTKSATPGVKLPKVLRDRRLTVRRETTAPETYRRGDLLNLSAEETATLPPAPATSVEMDTPEFHVRVEPGLGALLRDLRLAGEDEGTIAPDPVRLSIGEKKPPALGGAKWDVSGRGDLWKKPFRVARAQAGCLRLVEKAKKDKAHVVRTLESVAGSPLLRDRLELVPEKKGKDGKVKRPSIVHAGLELALELGESPRLFLPAHDRLVECPYALDPARTFLMYAGTAERHYTPEGGFAAAVGGRAVHVILYAPRETERVIADSRRDHPLVRLVFSRSRPPVTREIVHVLGRRAGFAGHRAVAVLAETTDAETGSRIAHVVAFRRGSRAATGHASLVDGERSREVTLERVAVGPVGAVHVGRVPLDGDAAGRVEVRLGKDDILIEEAP